MSALTNHAENLLLAWLLTTGTATRPTAWYVALHTEDPGEDGSTGELVVGTDPDYVRKSVTFATPADGKALSSAQVSWTAASGASAYTVTHISIWDAATSGNCLYKGPLLVPKDMVASQTWDINIGELIAALD